MAVKWSGDLLMLFGGYSEHTLDPNGRVIIPRKLRLSLGETFIITRGLEKCLRIFTQETFETIKSETKKLGNPLSWLLDPEILRIRRHLFAERVETTTDSQWRVMIPARLREYAEIANSVVLVGVGDWIEIWNPDNWKAYSEQQMTEEKLTRAASLLVRVLGPSVGDADVPPAGPSE